jgi:hypothetical protein
LNVVEQLVEKQAERQVRISFDRAWFATQSKQQEKGFTITFKPIAKLIQLGI